jgi:hypothetical protein
MRGGKVEWSSGVKAALRWFDSCEVERIQDAIN